MFFEDMTASAWRRCESVPPGRLALEPGLETDLSGAGATGSVACSPSFSSSSEREHSSEDVRSSREADMVWCCRDEASCAAK